MEEKKSWTWRIWVDMERQIVSFHPEEGFRLLEFHNRDLFLEYLEASTVKHFRYQ